MSVRAALFPGQGSQQLGMGAELFADFPDEVRLADSILGYSLEALCREGPLDRLSQTRFTQPALFAVDALTYLRRARAGYRPDYVLGHSLGEYAALFAAGAFDFGTGLRLCRARGELMAQSPPGGMAAILGPPPERVLEILRAGDADTIDVANFNSPVQTVISGPIAAVEAAERLFDDPAITFVPLNVSAAFHSRQMRFMLPAFESALAEETIFPPRMPVIANATARPYAPDRVRETLLEQICGCVRWTDSVRLLLAHGEVEIEEMGPGATLTTLTDVTRKHDATRPRVRMPNPGGTAIPRVSITAQPSPSATVSPAAEALGSRQFREAYGLKYAYQSGGMYRAIASKALVLRMAQAGLLGSLGTAGVSLDQINRDVADLSGRLPNGVAFAVNLLPHPRAEAQIVDIALQHGVTAIEASAYVEITEPLVRYRLSGLRRMADGEVRAHHRILAKVSREEVARAFLAPPPTEIVRQLVAAGKVTAAEADLAADVPMADDITAEANSGGHTDGGVLSVLIPSMIGLRNEVESQRRTPWGVRVGAAGGLGTPESIAAAFTLGADYVVTGSINQCTVEAATSELVKDILQEMDIHDTNFAPAADMFEIGAKVQVLSRGILFHARATKLYDLWRQYTAWEEVDPKTRAQVEDRYFQRSFDDVLAERTGAEAAAAMSPRQRMATVFKWYLSASSDWAISGDAARRLDFQVSAGPALGAFNRWVRGTDLDPWRARHADEIGVRLMTAAAGVLSRMAAA